MDSKINNSSINDKIIITTNDDTIIEIDKIDKESFKTASLTTSASSGTSTSALSTSLSSSISLSSLQKLKGYNYKNREQYIISRVGKLFDNRIPSQLLPFIEEQEFSEIIDSINQFKSLKEIKYNKIIYSHFGLFILFIICMAISGWRKKIAPIIIIIILIILLFISLFIIYRQVKPTHIKKEIDQFHRNITTKFKERGLSFKCTLITSNRKKYYRYVHVVQTSIIIYYPKKEDEEIIVKA